MSQERSGGENESTLQIYKRNPQASDKEVCKDQGSFSPPEDYHPTSVRILPRGCPSLAKPEPARDTTLGLRGLPLHCLIESINRLTEFLFRIILTLVELRSGIILKLFEFGLGFAHFGGDSLVGFVNLLADIIYLYADSLSAESNDTQRRAGEQASKRTVRSILEPAICAHSSPCFFASAPEMFWPLNDDFALSTSSVVQCQPVTLKFLVTTKGQTLGFLLRDFRIPSSSVEVITSSSDNRQADNRYPTSSHGSFLFVGLLLACEN